MNSPLCYIHIFLVLTCSFDVASTYHILGIFVNVHRSQLIVHLAVARAMLQHGHQLTLVTNLPLEDEWRYQNITHILLPPVDEQQQQKLPHSEVNFVTRLQWTLSRLEQSGQLLEQPLWHEFMHDTPSTRYDLLLLGYHFNDHLLGVAAHFNIPAVIISTQQPIGFVHSLLGNPEERWYVPQPYDSRQRTGFDGFILGLWEKFSELLARRVMQRIYSDHFPSPRYPSFKDMRRRVVLALNNHHMISEGPIAPLLPSMLDIGGIHLEQSIVENKIDIECGFSERPYIIFSLGTRFSWRIAPSDLVQSFVDAFAQLQEYDIYWTYDGHNASSISQAHSNLKLSKWWPQAQLLAQPEIQLFITHGGKGSLSEALYYGVPLLGLPLVGDQRANLQKMSRKGWGLTLDMHNISSAELLVSIRKLLNEADFRNNIRKDSLLYRDRPLNASALTTYWLEYVIRHKGAKHLYSPARELYFWEYYLLDVRFFVYGLLGILSCGLVWLNRLIN